MMLNKKSARAMAQSETVSIGDLRRAIGKARNRGGMSHVNPAIPLDRALDIYEAALAGRDEAEIPKAWRPDFYSRDADAVKLTGDALIMTNILRDCGPL